MSECIEYKGKLVIRDDWESLWSEPIRIRRYWPTGLLAKDFPHFIDKQANPYGTGLYLVNRQYVALEERGETKPVFVENEKIKKPRWAKYYRNGKWDRHSY